MIASSNGVFFFNLRCSTCRRCSQQISNGVDVSRMEGLCDTCFSLKKCAKCHHIYEVGDHIIKCQHCNRYYTVLIIPVKKFIWKNVFR